MSRNAGTRLARYARRLGFDRNPLRRRTDRIEAAIRLATTILLLVAMPIAVIAVGRQADQLALRQARAQMAKEHQATAVLLQRAQPTGVPDPYTSIQMTYVLARWQPPGGPPRSGQVLAPAGEPAESTVTVWVDASGAVALPPPDHRDIAGDVTIAAVVTGLVVSLLLLGSNALASRQLDVAVAALPQVVLLEGELHVVDLGSVLLGHPPGSVQFTATVSPSPPTVGHPDARGQWHRSPAYGTCDPGWTGTCGRASQYE